ncbi:MAG: PD-(D/E)XK nuclease-like domain-containing protein [Hymenobacteraceae bacterium]|nr:PD-(D/E)XK nuclease-like domain-containing protein [Hymenobacteraceae bacterium]
MLNRSPTAAPLRPDLLRLSYDDYRALPAVANSDLSRLRDFLNGRGARSAGNNAALSFGTAFHTALLEPDSYVPGQKGVNDSLVWWMVEAVHYDPDLLRMLETGLAEPSCVFTHAETGTLCKLRADLVIPTEGDYTIVDFKSTMANDWHQFAMQCSFFDYDRQAAFYLDALHADRFLLVGVQKAAPYGVFLVEVTPEMLAEGRAKYRALLTLLVPGREAEVLPFVSAEAVRAAVQELGLRPETDGAAEF